MTGRVLFLYNHDASHQAAHISGIMAELARGTRRLTVIAATGTPQIRQQVLDLIGQETAARIEFVDLSLSRTANALLSLPNRVAPLIRLARLKANLDLFAGVDVIVSPERTCLYVRRALGGRAPLFVYVPHGSGDRNVAYHPALAQFDYCLLSGQKLIDEMIAHGISTHDRCRLIGYAKFDAVADRPKVQLFENDRPTVVYNPHFDPKLSSWYDHGPALIEAIAARPHQFNLIVAPHVMLFRKKLHISPEYGVARVRPEIPPVAASAPNVKVDIGSERLFDMTYTRSSDIYLGDVSSQVYEFLREPRPCFFIDAASQGADAYPFWANGPVCRNPAEVMAALGDWRQVGERFRATQEHLFAYTMDIDPERSASKRGAEALIEILDLSGRSA